MDDWEALFEECGPALVLFATQWTESRSDAEDAVQDAFVRFWRSGRHRAEDPRPYLFACVKKSALDLRRGRLRRRRREERAGRERSDEQSLFESSADRDEWRAAAEAAMGRLPAEQREVVVLKIWGGLTFPQIGEAVGISPNTAASRHRYALEALRRFLTKQEVP